VDYAGILSRFSTAVPNPANYGHSVRQLYPVPFDSVDPVDAYLSDMRPAPVHRPWLMMNMVSSADGASSVDGLSGGLGGDGDHEAFRAIRASCDWIVVGAQTVRDERYRMPQPNRQAAVARTNRGWDLAPRLAVVSASGRFDPDLPLFTEDSAHRPLIITGDQPDPAAHDLLGHRAEWHTIAGTPTPANILEALADRGATTVLLEGGPRLNGQFVAAGLIDEVCVTFSPHLVGGASPRIVAGGEQGIAAPLQLTRLLEHEGSLIARYLCDRSHDAPLPGT